MKFKFGTKENIFVKIIADPGAEEQKWLPACEALGNKQIVKEDASNSQKKGPIASLLSGLGRLVSFGTLVGGQVFMVAVAACTTGSLASCIFGQSYDRVMYHSGPQDSILGFFILGAIPFFWIGWYFSKPKVLKPALLTVIGGLISYLTIAAFAGVTGIIAGLSSFLLLALFLYGGSYFVQLRNNWPRRFSVTGWLPFFYLPAIALFAYEFSQLDLDPLAIDKAEPGTLFAGMALLSGFLILPSFLNAVSSGTRRCASAFGLAMIGQSPVLMSLLLYTVLNGIMLAAFSLAGGNVLHDYFAASSPPSLDPDFDLKASSQAELVYKLLCSAMVLAVSFIAVYLGSVSGVVWNRLKKAKPESQ